MEEIRVRERDRKKAHVFISEPDEDSGTRKGWGQNNQGRGWEGERVSKRKRYKDTIFRIQKLITALNEC